MGSNPLSRFQQIVDHRRRLINIPARLAYSAGTYTLHRELRRETPFMSMFDNVLAPPQGLASK